MTKAEKAAYDREYRAKNKARIAENKRAYVTANAGKEAERVKAWVKANRERSNEIKNLWKSRNPQPSKRTGAPEERIAARKAAAVGRVRTWRAAHPEQHRSAEKASATKNSAKNSARAAAWRATNPDKVKLNSREHYEKNPSMYAKHRVARRTSLAQATPLWSDAQAIARIYAEAKQSGMEVDHVIPLKGKLVSGLHVHTNLQLLTPTKNRMKGNRYAC